jgi:hypothetical protein
MKNLGFTKIKITRILIKIYRNLPGIFKLASIYIFAVLRS